ncbi:MAG: GNAT family N-acetyltransferase, partial [Bdellovibrionales bacterium]|nr:GNAT family N-acetyltransferase [Bdellovibrionales bacterium]
MVQRKSKEVKVTVRRWRKSDLDGIFACQRAAYPEFSSDELCEARHYELQFKTFPEGQFLAEVDGKIVGYATSLIVELDQEDLRYRYGEITGGGTFGTHDPSGDTLYGADIAVLPGYQGLGIAGQLYKRRKQLVRQLNLKRMVAYGLIPGYLPYSGKLSPMEYIEKVKAGELKDTALTAQYKAGYEVKGILLDFVGDPRSLNNATF